MLDFSYKANPRDYPRRSDRLKRNVSLNGSDEKSIFVSARPSRRTVLHERGRGPCEKDRPLRRTTETHRARARGGEG